MAIKNIKLYFDSTEIDITNSVRLNSIKRDENLYNNLEPTTNKCSFVLKGSKAVDTYHQVFSYNGDIECIIYNDDDSVFFSGYLCPNYKGNINSYTGLSDIELSIEDYGIKHLQRILKDSVIYIGYKVCNTANPNASIVHKLLSLAGETKFELENINITIPYYNYFYSDKKTYWKLLQEILFESGYTFYYDIDGTFKLHNWSVADLINNVDTWKSTDTIKKSIQSSKSREDYSSLCIDWTTLELKEGITLFNDDNNSSATNNCNVELQAGEDYLENSSIKTVYTDYNNESYTINGVLSVTLDAIYESGITLYKPLANYGRKFSISFLNESASVKKITKFSIIGSAYVEGESNSSYLNIETISGRDAKEYNYTASFLHNKNDIDNFANGIKNHYKYSDIRLTISSSVDKPLGSILQINEDYFTDISIYTKIIGKRTYDNGSYEYETEGISTFTFEECSDDVTINNPPRAEPIKEVDIGGVVSNYIGLSGVVQTITVGENWTETPTTPVLEYIPQINAIIFKWDRQANLSNLGNYHVQVSSDNSNWYPLCFDRTNYYSNTINSYSEWQSEMLVHTLPLSNSEIVSYYYRVRRVTRDSVMSDWSSSILASTTLIDDGNIATNSISANKIESTVINSMIGNFTDSITITNNGLVGASYKTPIYENRALYLDGDELSIKKLVKQTELSYTSDNSLDFNSNSLPSYELGLSLYEKIGKYNGLFYMPVIEQYDYNYSSNLIAELWLFKYKIGKDAQLAYQSKALLRKGVSINDEPKYGNIPTAQAGKYYTVISQANYVQGIVIHVLNMETNSLIANTIIDVGDEASYDYLNIVGISDNKFLLVFRSGSNGLYSYCLTVSDTSVTVSNRTIITTNTITYINIFSKVAENKVMLMAGNDYRYLLGIDANDDPIIITQYTDSSFVSYTSNSYPMLPLGNGKYLIIKKSTLAQYCVITFDDINNIFTFGTLTNLDWTLTGNDLLQFTTHLMIDDGYVYLLNTLNKPDLNVYKYSLSGNQLIYVDSYTRTLTDYKSSYSNSIEQIRTYLAVTSDNTYGFVYWYFDNNQTKLKCEKIGYYGKWETDLIIGGGSSQITADTITVKNYLASGFPLAFQGTLGNPNGANPAIAIIQSSENGGFQVVSGAVRIPKTGWYKIDAFQLLQPSGNIYWRLLVNNMVVHHSYGSNFMDYNTTYTGLLAEGDLITINVTGTITNSWGGVHSSVNIIGLSPIKGADGYQLTGQSIIVSSSEPAEGNNGDIWIQI